MQPKITMHDFIRPKIPICPILSIENFGRNTSKAESVTDVGPHFFLTSGRVAIAEALRLLEIKENDEVLVPAYHCNSMVEPIVWLKARPTFFQIQSNTEVNLTDIERKITPKTKAILVTHYFGFHQPMRKIKTLCDKYGIKIIEDCAHAFFGTIDDQPIGSFGDYAIASTMKFFPVFDGGCLTSKHHSLKELSLETGGAGFQIKAAVNTIEKSLEYNRLNAISYFLSFPLWLKDQIWTMTKRHSKPNTFNEIAPASSSGGFNFNPKWLNKEMSFISKFTITHCNIDRIIQKRRENYLYIHEKLSELPGTHSLFKELPENVTPYVYPLVYENPEKHFVNLKNKGVPIIRFGEFLWEGIDKTVCENSVNLSKCVFQFPCHQELNKKELDWMINTILVTQKTI